MCMGCFTVDIQFVNETIIVVKCLYKSYTKFGWEPNKSCLASNLVFTKQRLAECEMATSLKIAFVSNGSQMTFSDTPPNRKQSVVNSMMKAEKIKVMATPLEKKIKGNKNHVFGFFYVKIISIQRQIGNLKVIIQFNSIQYQFNIIFIIIIIKMCISINLHILPQKKERTAKNEKERKKTLTDKQNVSGKIFMGK